jgi:DNA-binding IclR family transcriptional regulator
MTAGTAVRFMRSYQQQHGHPASVRVIARHFSHSTSSVHRLLRLMHRDGLIEQVPVAPSLSMWVPKDDAQVHTDAG